MHSSIVLYTHGVLGVDAAPPASNSSLSSVPVPDADHRARATFAKLLDVVRSAYVVDRAHHVASAPDQCVTPSGNWDVFKLRQRMAATPYVRWLSQAAMSMLVALATADSGVSPTHTGEADGPSSPPRVQEHTSKRRQASPMGPAVLSPSLSPTEAAFVARKHEWMHRQSRISRAMFNKGRELYGLRLIAPRHHVATRLSVLARARAKRQKKAYVAGGESVARKCILCATSTTRVCSICLRPLCYAEPDPALMVLSPRSAATKQCWDVWHAHNEEGVPTTSMLQRVST